MASPANDKRVIVLAWIDENPRTRDLARWLHGRAEFMPWARPGRPTWTLPGSWLRSWSRTWRLMRTSSATTIVVVVPPVFAALCAVLARRRGTKLYFDLHSGALNDPRWTWSRPLMSRLSKQADGAIVTNNDILQGFSVGCPLFQLHDPIWASYEDDWNRRPSHRPSVGRTYVVFPAGGAPDEPIDDVIQAGALLNDRPRIVITGRVDPPAFHPGVEFVGYLPRKEYEDLLRGAAAVLSLTKWEATMQRSAYEAVALGLPILALDQRVLREVFSGGGGHFVQSGGRALAEGVHRVVHERGRLLSEIPVARRRLLSGATAFKANVLNQAEPSVRGLSNEY